MMAFTVPVVFYIVPVVVLVGLLILQKATR